VEPQYPTPAEFDLPKKAAEVEKKLKCLVFCLTCTLLQLSCSVGSMSEVVDAVPTACLMATPAFFEQFSNENKRKIFEFVHKYLLGIQKRTSVSDAF